MKSEKRDGSPFNRCDVWLALALVLTAGLAFYPFAALRLDGHHDGIILKPALDVLSGQVLFRDSFTQYGPLTTYIQAQVLRIDPTLLSLRLLSAAAQACALGFFFLAWRAIMPRPLAVLSGVLFIAFPMFYYPLFVMLPWSSTLALFFQSVALLAAVCLAFHGSSAVWGWVLGAAAACVFWCRQPVGACLVLALGGCGLGLRFTGWSHPDGWRRIAGRVLAGGGVVSLLILGHLALNGALDGWWEQNVLWPRRWAAEVGENAFPLFMGNLFLRSSAETPLIVLGLFFLPSIVRRWWRELPAWVEPVWWAALVLAYWLGAGKSLRFGLIQSQPSWFVCVMLAAAGALLWVLVVAVFRTRKSWARDDRFHALAVVVAVALASLPQIYPMTSGNHVFWAVAPALGLLAYGVYRLTGLEARYCTLGLLLVMSGFIHEKFRWGFYTIGEPRVTLQSPPVLRGVRVDADLAEAIGRVDAVLSRALAASPPMEAIMYGDDALYLAWFANRENPSPYYVTWPALLSPEDIEARWNFVVERRPVVFVNGQTGADLKYLPSDYKLALHEPALNLKILLPGWLRREMDQASKSMRPE